MNQQQECPPSPQKSFIIQAGPQEVFNQDVYDAVLDVTTVPDIEKGWKISVRKELDKLMRDKLQQLFAQEEKRLNPPQVKKLSEALLPGADSATVVSVLGLFDRGKTFILKLLSGEDFPSSEKVHTIGLSMKLPASLGGQILVLDTAGSDSPLHKVELDSGWEDGFDTEWKKEKKKVNDDGEIDDDLMEDSDWSDLEKDKKIFVELALQRALDRSIAEKKATEIFLNDLIFALSDVLIVVVNQMTWKDQQFIHATSKQVLNAKNKNPNDPKRLIVVHNFKTTTEIDQFKLHRKEYVESCYVGSLRKEKLTVKGQPREVEFFQTDLGDITHLFLAQQDAKGLSPAAEIYNAPTVEYLRVLLQATSNRKREPLLNRLCTQTKGGLESFFAGLKDVGLFVNKDSISLKARPDAKGTLKLLADEVIYDGANIFLVRPDDFKVQVDVLEEENGLIIAVDVPGCPSQGSELGDSGCAISYFIDKRKHQLVLTGERSLYLRRYIEHENKMMVTSNCAVYDRTHGKVTKMERKYGKIERRVDIPDGFADEVVSVWLEHGVLQLLIPRDSNPNGTVISSVTKP